MNTILREVTQLSDRDCFLIFSREKDKFSFPTHIHREYELNMIEHGAGAARLVGDSVEDIGDLELTLVGPNIEHSWFQHKCTSKKIKEVTIQFHANLLDEQLLQRNQFKSVKDMFDKAQFGVTFNVETISTLKEKIYELASEKEGAYSVLKLFGILFDLSLSEYRTLSSKSFNSASENYDSRRIEKVFTYLLENYDKDICLSDISELVGMTPVSFSRFFKMRTGRSYIESLTDIRLGHSARMLIDTTRTVSEICMSCGFNNISNFNRIFKKKKGYTPSEFRDRYKESKLFI